MGFRNLRLIDPCDPLDEEALMLAHGSHEILRSAPVGLHGLYKAVVNNPSGECQQKIRGKAS